MKLYIDFCSNTCGFCEVVDISSETEGKNYFEKLKKDFKSTLPSFYNRLVLNKEFKGIVYVCILGDKGQDDIELGNFNLKIDTNQYHYQLVVRTNNGVWDSISKMIETTSYPQSYQEIQEFIEDNYSQGIIKNIIRVEN